VRPHSIIRFERFFLASLLLGLLNTVFSFRHSVSLLNADPIIGGTGYAIGMLVTTLVISIGIQLLLWFFIARKASNVAKWILVVLTVLGFVMAIPSIGTLMAQGAVTLIFTFFITVLQIIAIIHLFRPDAKAWLESRGTMGTNPDIFS
jgi:hypothetical protein